MSVAADFDTRGSGQKRDGALAALRQGQLDQAATLARLALSADPGDVIAAQTLGQALLTQDRAREAVDALRAPTALSQDAGLETLLARALAMAGRSDEAFDQLRRTTSRRPPFVLAFLELGELLGRAGRSDEALAVFAEGLTLAPDAAVLRLGLGHLHLSLNDRARARALFAEVCAAAPQRFDAKLALAKVLELDGDFSGAATLYASALELRPDDPAAQVRLGKCLLELGEQDAGEAALKRAARRSGGAAWLATAALAAASRGRLFLKPSDAARFLRAEAA
jgi:tetratricopeptide (TPR) repeat protein